METRAAETPSAAPTGNDPAGHDPDLELVRRIGRGDRAACTLFVDRHLDRVHRLAWRLLGDRADAEEATQDVFLKVWEQAARWRPGAAKFSTWLYRVTTNLCYDRLRRRREHVPIEDVMRGRGGLDRSGLDKGGPVGLDGGLDATPTPEQSAVAHERDARLRAALDALPQRQRSAIILCHHEGLSQREAAAVLEISEEALESLLARGRRTLRAVLMDTSNNCGFVEPP